MLTRSRIINALGGIAIVAITAPSPAQPWSDNFDSYAAESQISGQGGWQSTPGDFIGAFVIAKIAHSKPHAMQTGATTNLFRPLSTSAGRWTFTAWQFIPSFFLFGPTNLIIDNQLSGFSGTQAIRLAFSPDGFVTDELRPGKSVAMAFDQWAEIRVEIDLDRDLVESFYNDEPVSSGEWTVSGGAAAIAAVNVLSNAQMVFYDDFSLLAATVPADLDGDGDVDGVDLGMLLAQWTGPAMYAPCPPFRPADLNQDCRVDGMDLGMLLAAWG